jgi:hypothetical protein|tara:strand:+ start:348 stop:566 length:219 start_codon:yes stop_codon:yes gene_type:complete
MVKKYCEFDCPLQDKGAQIEAEINSMLEKLTHSNKEINPICLKRFVAETLNQRSSIMLIELVEDNKIEKRTH